MKVKVLAAILAASGSLSSVASGAKQPEMEYYTKLYEQNTDQICFSIKELPRCKPDYNEFSNRAAFADMLCLNKADQNAVNWLNQIQKGFSVADDLKSQAPNSKARVLVPTRCVDQSVDIPKKNSMFIPEVEFSLLDSKEIELLSEARRKEAQEALAALKAAKDFIEKTLPALNLPTIGNILVETIKPTNYIPTIKNQVFPELPNKYRKLDEVLDLEETAFEQLHILLRSYVDNVGLSSHLESLSTLYSVAVQNAEQVYLNQNGGISIDENKRREFRVVTERVYVYMLHSLLRELFAPKTLKPADFVLRVNKELPIAINKVWLSTSLQMDRKQSDRSKLIAMVLDKNIQARLENQLPLISLNKQQLTSILYTYNKMLASGMVLWEEKQ